jgi:hypothetical protein
MPKSVAFIIAAGMLQTYFPICSPFPSIFPPTVIENYKDTHKIISFPTINHGFADSRKSLLSLWKGLYSINGVRDMGVHQRMSSKRPISCNAALWEASESKVKIRECNVWYKVLRPTINNRGTDSMLPVLVLHGGPGIPSDYLETLGLLTEKYGRKVYFYDQIGCGNSDEPEDPSFYSVEQCAEVSLG